MASTPPLATPIQSLPSQPSTGGAPSAPPTAITDPGVADVLNEMEKVVSQAETYQHHPLMQPHMSLPSPPPSMFYNSPLPPEKSLATSWIQIDNAKRATVAMILALVFFYPSGIFPAIYHKISKLGFLENYDLFVRVFLLGALFYTVLTYVPL